MHPKLTWLNSLCASLGHAMGTSMVFKVEDTVDPLMKKVTIELGDDLGKGDYNPVQKMVHAFSKANDCVVHRIRRENKKLLLEVMTKSRAMPTTRVMNKNPITE